LKHQIEQGILQQPNKDESHRLRISGKCGDFDLSNDNNQPYNDRINIGYCATSIYQPHSNLSLEGNQKLFVSSSLKNLVVDLNFLDCHD
jgi:hypothetical protein